MRLNLNPMARASRLERKFAKLGTRTPCCFMCGETDPDCLDLDHPTSRKRDSDFTQILCANCHRKETYKRVDAGIPMCRERSPEELVRMRLLALADSHESSTKALRKWATSMEDQLCQQSARRKVRKAPSRTGADRPTRLRIAAAGLKPRKRRNKIK